MKGTSSELRPPVRINRPDVARRPQRPGSTGPSSSPVQPSMTSRWNRPQRSRIRVGNRARWDRSAQRELPRSRLWTGPFWILYRRPEYYHPIAVPPRSEGVAKEYASPRKAASSWTDPRWRSSHRRPGAVENTSSRRSRTLSWAISSSRSASSRPMVVLAITLSDVASLGTGAIWNSILIAAYIQARLTRSRIQRTGRWL